MMMASPEIAPAPYGALPSARQLAWHQLETYAFIHFSPNTFTDKEWGYGDEEPAIFNPTDFDANQIVESIRGGGLKGIILVCKHHDGLCLWPTKTTDHNISHSPWRNGKGDLVREISDACRRHGMKFGVYLSPWDRNNAHYGKPEYVDIYRKQLTELLTQYGPIFEVWHDGANGGDGFYGGARESRQIDRRTYYGWPETWNLVRKLQPNAVIFSDVGPDVRWVGNESGFAAETSWATYDPVGEDGTLAAPGFTRYAEGETGHRNGTHWLPAECDVSIRPGWFWHAAEDDKVRSVENLKDLYYKSVGRGGSFLLNVPPDRRGRVHDQDVASLRGFGNWLKSAFAQDLARGAKISASDTRGTTFAASRATDGKADTYFATPDGVTTAMLTLDFGHPVTLDTIRIREAIALGQRIDTFKISADGAEVASGTSVGSCRLVKFAKPITTARLTVQFTASAPITVSELGVFRTESPN